MGSNRQILAKGFVMIRELQFPEYTNNDINTALLCDKLNEVIRVLNSAQNDPQKALKQKEVVDTPCEHDFYVMNQRTGVRRCRKCKIVVRAA